MAFLEILLVIILPLFFVSLFAPKNTFLPWNWPFLRMTPTMYFKSHQVYDKITQLLIENKGTVLFKTSWITSTDILVTSDSTNVQHVMNTKFSIYQRGSEFRNVFDFLGEAVFNKDLEEWKQERKFTNAFFREPQYLKSIPKTIHHTLEKGLIPILDHASQNNQVLDLQNLFNRYMLDATCRMTTGFESGALHVGFPKCRLLDAMDDIAEAVFYRHILPEKVWKLQRYFNSGKEKKLAEASRTFNQILSDYVSKKRDLATAKNNQEQDGESGFDVLKFYLNSSEQRHANVSYLAGNLMTLLFAGRDTSGALLTWFFYLISKYPLVETKILEEIKQVFGEPPESDDHVIFSNVEKLSKLVYLHSALSESLRLFPTAPFLLRVPEQEDVLPSGHKVDKTTKVMLCSYAMGRMPEIWGEDCGEFKPDRWMCDRGGVKHVLSSTFLVFSSGPWTCPGRELAFTRMKAVAATILYNFRVAVLEGQCVSPSISAILTMKHGLKANVASRLEHVAT